MAPQVAPMHDQTIALFFLLFLPQVPKSGLKVVPTWVLEMRSPEGLVGRAGDMLGPAKNQPAQKNYDFIEENSSFFSAGGVLNGPPGGPSMSQH